MKTLRNVNALPVQVLVLGAAAAAVRGLLYLAAVDEKNLLTRGHPLSWLLWALCAAAAVLIAAAVPALKGSNRYAHNFRGHAGAAAGCWAFALGILLSVLNGDILSQAALLLPIGILAAAGLGWAGYDRMRGKQPNVLTYAALCLYLSLHIVSRYQSWSSNPQALDWVFSLLAAAALALSAYHQSCFCADSGHRRLLLGTELSALFLCCAALPCTDHFALYLCGGIWAFTGLCRIAPLPEEQTAKETE